MESIDRDLKEKLSEGPFGPEGFDERLKQRIERKISDRAVKRPHRFGFIYGGIGAVFAVILVLCVGSIWEKGSEDEAGMSTSYMTSASQKESAPVQAAAAETQKLRSALLLGLRNDDTNEGQPSAAYRTILIAPEGNSFSRAAEGRGILMPHQQKFWWLDLVASGSGKMASELVKATPAEMQQGEPEVFNGKSVGRIEKLLYVGNRYVALEQTISATGSQYVWVKDVPQLASGERQADPLQEPHVSLADAINQTTMESQALESSKFAAREQLQAGESWTIQRTRGQWVAASAAYSNEEPGYQLSEMPVTMPETVITHDKVSIDWNDVVKVQPQARDVYQSPDGDMVVVVTESQVIAYPYRGLIEEKAGLVIPIAEGESVIMAQWATENYVELWKQEVSKLLNR